MAIYKGTTKVAGGVAQMITVTKAQYDALTDEEKLGNIYLTTDEPEASLNLATPYTNGLQSATDKAKFDGLLDWFYPIGSIYPTVSPNLDTKAKVEAHFGGTWEAWGQGRVPIGVGAIVVNTDTAEGIVTAGEINKVAADVRGGEKAHVLAKTEMPAHVHEQNILQGTTAGSGAWDFSGNAIQKNVTVPNSTGFNTVSTGGGLAHNNVQPYVTCYMWKRIA